MFSLKALSVALALLLVFPATVSADMWVKYRVLLHRSWGNKCENLVHKKPDNLRSGHCSNFKHDEPFDSYWIQYYSHKGDDVPEKAICIISAYEDYDCTGRYDRMNATSILAKCVHNLGNLGNHTFQARSMNIDCIGGNEWHDHNHHIPELPEDWPADAYPIGHYSD
ncbi:hypothetical protein LTR22_018706 [Elasticomyces elasticus]|nr:hypothetical protein LTR22_018706 [Elasticomyces elasticus]